MKIKSAEEALKSIQSGDSLFIHTAAAAPQHLVRKMAERAGELRNVKIYQLHTDGDAPYANPGMEESFQVNAMFIGKNVRECIQSGRGSYIPVFLSEVPLLFRRRIIPLDVALISVSPPDKHGFCSLGPSVDASQAAVECAGTIIAQINKHIPRTHGDSQLHVSRIDYGVEHDEPLPEHPAEELTEQELAIGRHAAGLIEDGSTLQMGIGAIPNATLAALKNHKDLGIHTEMFSDGIIPLVEKGVINGRRKHTHPGKIVSSFVIGSRKIYDFINDNPGTVLLDCAYVNNTAVIRKNPRVVAINSAIEIDLTGQVCADSIGSKMYSGVGGQMDFIRGASLSEGGKPIIALPSVTGKGISRIARYLNQGAGVVTTRAHVHYVVTEYGVAHLYGKSLKQRANALIEIAHPNHREQLEKDAANIFHRDQFFM